GGRFFDLDVKQHQRVEAGDLLARVDLDGVRSAGYDTTTIVVVINTMTLGSVTPRKIDTVRSGDAIIDVTP
ncbi:PTS glucose transporter subunit IIA, partial [Sedimentibacter sp. B4]|uniref:PTS glucose transporter subunit IIA n=1 Tax=Sedimentibacter sp. B4 TaxID=304766 RepID=UPI0018DC7DAD